MAILDSIKNTLTDTQGTVNTINDLKNSLNGGSRPNKYMIELAFPGIDAKKFNILCKAAGFPQRSISTGNIWYQGRKYQVRGETDYGGEYEVTVVDDSKMSMRKSFDKWLTKVDNSKPKSGGLFGGSGSTMGNALDLLNSGASAISSLKNVLDNPKQVLGSYAKGILDPGSANAGADYQTEITIWQLSNTGKKVYGYVLQNAFPKMIGPVQFSADSNNTLTEFTITFAFSEFDVANASLIEDLGFAALGDSGKEAFDTVTSLFD